MKLNYRYQTNSQILDLIKNIEINHKVISKLPQTQNIAPQILSQHILQSSLYSAQIEGNPLTLNQIISSSALDSNNHQLEIQNLVVTYDYVFSNTTQPMTPKFIHKLHSLCMDKLTPSGKFRIQPSAIYNQTGIAIYLPPPSDEIQPLIDQLIEKYDTQDIILSIIFHFGFEKIHPFLDGNGRVGRLLLTHQLNQAGFNFQGLLVLEKFIRDNRSSYYDLLNSSGKDLTAWITFFLEGIFQQSEKIIQQSDKFTQDAHSDLLSLTPRRQEIVRIIRDHHQVSFDFIHRRFLKVPKSTLHHDLKALTTKEIIRKLGATRGALYEAV